MATRAHGRAREAQPHMDVRLRRLPKDCFFSYKSFEPLMREALNICLERTHPGGSLSCAKTV